MSSSRIRAVVFDVCGVLVEQEGVRDLSTWTNETSEEAIWSRWRSCAFVSAYERGEISSQEFCRGLVESWSLPIRTNEFMERFRRWPARPVEGASQLLASLDSSIVVTCLSNSNPVHWERIVSLGVGDRFTAPLLSHELGCVKPDPKCFALAIERLSLEPSEILFFDDNAENVQAARRCGIQAFVSTGIDEASRVLAELGISRDKPREWIQDPPPR